MARRQRRAGRARSRSSATGCGSSTARTTAALFGLFQGSAIVLGDRLARRHRPDRRLPRPGRAERSYLSVALGLLLGGAIGNLIDRLRYGYVVDFVDIGIGDLRFYTFNVADAAISVAILLLIAAGAVPGARPGRRAGPLRWLSGRAARLSGVRDACASRTAGRGRVDRYRGRRDRACRGATSRSSSPTAG